MAKHMKKPAWQRPGPKESAIGFAGEVTLPEIAEERRRLQAAGVTGADLEQQVRTFRDKRLEEQRTSAATRIGGSSLSGLVRNPVQFERQLAHGRGPAFRRLALLQRAREMLGTEAPAAAYEKHMTDLLHQAETDPESLVNERRDTAPTMSALSQYAQSHLGQGLTPEEEAAARGRGQEAIGGGAADAYRQEGEREAAAGIDPRSGIAAQRAMQIERGTEQARAGLERDITEENLARKGSLENLAVGQSGLENAARVSDVSANLQRLAAPEAGMFGQEQFRNAQLESALGYTESQRQARMARQAAAKAGRSLKPSGLEQGAAIASGVLGGLTGK